MGTDKKPLMDSEYRFPNIIGISKAIKDVFVLMNQAIEMDVDILITGETGTGKNLVAKEIHNHSPRRDNNLIAINCGITSKEALFSELFGHRKDAFKDAIEDREGIFEAVNGGTVILDNIDQMPLDVQLSLVNVLDERKVQRLGEYVLRDVAMRVIAISNQDISREIETGNFREDLYRKLKKSHIHLPSLQERQEDIPLLAEYFYNQLCCQMPKALSGFASGVMDMLQRYTWAGNVRELRNEIIQACMLTPSGERIQKHRFSSHIRDRRL
jgi:DNA-binding NtrC family response regulator